MKQNDTTCGAAQQKGFNLIEILVTVIILAIGLLGVAGMQLTGLKYSQGAYHRSQVVVMTNDIVDRMRANRAAAESGSYDIAIGDAANGFPCDVVMICNPVMMADADLAEWKQALAANLPSGDGSIERNGNVFTITIQWDDSRGQLDPKTMAVETIL